MPVYDHKHPRAADPELKRSRNRRLLTLSLCMAALTSLGAIWSSQASRSLYVGADEVPPETDLTAVSDSLEAEEAEAPDDETAGDGRTIEGRIASRQVFADALMRHGVRREQVFELVRSLRSGIHRDEFNPDIVQTGDLYFLTLDSLGAVQSFEYTKKGSLENRFLSRRDGSGQLRSWKERFPLDRQVVVVAGQIDDTLWNALSKSGERPDYLSSKMTEIFEYDVDFMVDCRASDRFALAVEKLYKDGEFVRYGDVLAAEYRQARKSLKAYLYEAPDGDAAYYDEEGKSLRGLFLKSPLNYRRISSGFNRKRFHPILKKYIPHHGIDYAADYGTPVWATAGGVITSIGRKGALGNYVEIKHKNGYKTGYGHLSKFRRELKKGARVKQKTVIGYVGATGRATGPHLHYNFIVNQGGKRKYVDAGTVVNRPTGKPVAIGGLAHFRNHRDSLWALLSQVDEAVATASLNVTDQYREAFAVNGTGSTE